MDTSRIDVERVLGPLCAGPLPVSTKGPDGRPERWARANPAFMWHPLMWLPPHLALRSQYRAIDDCQGGGTSEDTTIESDEIWTIRVALELVNSGLYNQTGTPCCHRGPTPRYQRLCAEMVPLLHAVMLPSTLS